jgi:hypothetical protein
MEPIAGIIGLYVFSEIPVNSHVVSESCCTPSIYCKLLLV